MKIFLSILFVIVPNVPALTQPKVLTMAHAVETALRHNLNVQQAQNNVEAAEASLLAAYGSYLPTVSLGGQWSRTQTVAAPTTRLDFFGRLITLDEQRTIANSFGTQLNVDYTVFDGFSREANWTKASSNKASAEHTMNRTKQAIVFQTESAYLNVLRTEQLVRVSEENLKRGQRQLERIIESNRLGALSLADVYRQQSAVASDELALITAQNNYNKAKADLIALIGLDPMNEYQIADASIQSDIDQADIEGTVERYRNQLEIRRKALAARPDYHSSRENYIAASSGVTQARRGYIPTVRAFGSYGLSNTVLEKISDNKRMQWGLSFSWSLFDGLQTNQALQAAQAQERNAELLLAQTERAISVEVKKALLDLEAARKQYEVAQKGLVAAAQDRRIAEERYNVGSGTLLDLLTANAGLVRAEADKINAVYNYIIAKRNVEYAVGERLY
ncbi:MAG TPA: TolC family protein [Bacteroidota bacterium]|nr:TolC family protein [Bacteroidota bacterium]